MAFTNRLYRLFVMVNGNKTFEVNRIPVTAGINGSNPASASSPQPQTPGLEAGKKKGEPVYEAKLVAGVNRVEVEIVAERERKEKDKEKEKGGEKEKEGSVKEQIESEKCTIFLHLTRSL